MKIICGAVILIIATLWFFTPKADKNRGAAAVAAAERIRADLQKKGFKLSLEEMDLTPLPASAERARVLQKVCEGLHSNADYLSAIRSIWANDKMPIWMPTKTGTDQIVYLDPEQLPAQEVPPVATIKYLWQEVGQRIQEVETNLTVASDTLISGPFQVELLIRTDNVLLPHLAPYKRLTEALHARLLFDLHDENSERAWLDLLAMTRLATAWKVEPVDLSYVNYFKCLSTVFDATSEVLESEHWTEEQLRTLQREWASLDLWKSLPETAAFSRGIMLSTLVDSRNDPIDWDITGMTFGESLLHPIDAVRMIFHNIRENRRQKLYRSIGTYEDETALLQYYCDQENNLVKVQSMASWSEIRVTPGATNFLFFSSKHPSRFGSRIKSKEMLLKLATRGGTVLMRTAEAETRRRIVITALALERFRKRYQQYPRSLSQLVPEFLAEEPIDFMDGKPLRYRNVDSGFVLRSVGSDCIEDIEQQGAESDPADMWTQPVGEDIVWKRTRTASPKSQEP